MRFVEGYRSILGTEYPLTKLFFGICALVFAAVMLQSGGKLDPFGGSTPLSTLLRWGILSGPLWGVSDVPVSFAEPWRYVSAIFLHLGLLHVVFNGMALLQFGRVTEERFGSARFAVIFVLTGALGFIASDVWQWVRGAGWGPTAGASGSIFGLIGALVGDLYARKDKAYKDLLWQIGVFTLVMIVARFPVNHAAHFGGFAVGLPLGYWFQRENRPWRFDAIFGWLAAALVVLSITSILLSQRSPFWQERRRLELMYGAVELPLDAWPTSQAGARGALI